MHQETKGRDAIYCEFEYLNKTNGTVRLMLMDGGLPMLRITNQNPESGELTNVIDFKLGKTEVVELAIGLQEVYKAWFSED